jgi:hypothetical protein
MANVKDSDEAGSSPMAALQVELTRMKKATLSAAAEDVDRIIDLLVSAREQVANGALPRGVQDDQC